ncbi:hypothetical protein HCN44_000879 [Aphidius gifuensis]|uniref:Uncharacterized protein n=1 Tax=Aphidius gifuensis TaxID=684658 RepID=A0A834XK39_APHGI|nr:hypothetical protein HCN44_000879 [Aphidius gifuensis]
MSKDEIVYVLVQDYGEETVTVVDKRLIIGNPSIETCKEFIDNQTQQVLRWPTSESEKDLAQLAINYLEVDHTKCYVILLGVGTKKEMIKKEHKYLTSEVSDKNERKEVCKKNFDGDDSDNECLDNGSKGKKRKGDHLKVSDIAGFENNDNPPKKNTKEKLKKSKMTFDDAS